MLVYRWVCIWVVALTSLMVQAQPPFWRAKEKVYQRIKNREIIVSAREVKSTEGFKYKLTIAGGGHVRASEGFVFAQSHRLPELLRESSYIESVKVEEGGKILNISLKAYGHATQMRVRFEPREDTKPRRWDFEVLEGSVRGLKGRVELVDFSPGQTEIGLDAEFAYNDFPIPRLFLEFGFEVVFQRMAFKMRQKLESEYAKSKKAAL